MEYARLTRYGTLAVTGADARAFLHAQLTKDIANLPPGMAALAGWCSAKGRLLATFLVIPRGEGFLLQLARDLAPAIAKRLSMFVLRAKVKVTDESERWHALGAWGKLPGMTPPAEALAVTTRETMVAVRIDAQRSLLLATDPIALEGREIDETAWTLAEIRAGRPLVSARTQELFVPQMVNLHSLGGVDFRKGCYPGQEIVARAQYRGQVKRHMVHGRAPAASALVPGAPYGDGGTIVDAAPAGDEIEFLAVVPSAEAG